MHRNEAELREIMRNRVMEQETSDPIAVRLLHDIIVDLETELSDRNQVQVRMH
jgi:plasmid stability protein